VHKSSEAEAKKPKEFKENLLKSSIKKHFSSKNQFITAFPCEPLENIFVEILERILRGFPNDPQISKTV